MSQKIIAKLILHTIPQEGLEKFGLYTFEVNIPYYVWVELLTHKRFARNASSNRAMTVSNNINELGYYKPDTFYKKGIGMKSGDAIKNPSKENLLCNTLWDQVWQLCTEAAVRLEEIGVAKEQASRVLPTFKMMKGLMTGTYDAWKCFLELRNSEKADRAMQELAMQINQLIDHSRPKISKYHIPFLNNSLDFTEECLYICAGRIARLSYGNIESKDNDYQLGVRLLNDKHLSPFEGIAKWERNPLESAILSKFEDYYFKDGVYEGMYGWANLRSYYEVNGNLHNFIEGG